VHADVGEGGGEGSSELDCLALALSTIKQDVQASTDPRPDSPINEPEKQVGSIKQLVRAYTLHQRPDLSFMDKELKTLVLKREDTLGDGCVSL
jgi:hypothetical protein